MLRPSHANAPSSHPNTPLSHPNAPPSQPNTPPSHPSAPPHTPMLPHHTKMLPPTPQCSPLTPQCSPSHPNAPPSHPNAPLSYPNAPSPHTPMPPRTIGTAPSMPRREVQYPPYRALPPPSPFRRGRRGPLPHSRLHAWEQQTRRWMTRCNPAPTLRLWLSHVSQALPTRLLRSEQSLASVVYALHILGGLLPSHLCLEDILMGCFLHWTATGADRRWVLSALQRVPQRLAVSGPALHEALGWRYGAGAPLWRSPRLHRSEGTRPDKVAPLLAPLWDLGPPSAAAGPPPRKLGPAPCSARLVVEGRDDVAEGSGGPRRHLRVPLPGQPVPRHAPQPVCGSRRGAGLDPHGICRVVCGIACPGGAPAAPAAPVPPGGRGRHRACVVRRPRAHAGMATTLQGASRLSRALTQGPRVSFRRSPDAPPSPPLPPYPGAPPPPPAKCAHRPPPSPPQASQGAAIGVPPPPPARGHGRGVHCMHGPPICRVVGTAIERPQAACEPQDRPSNQIKSNPNAPPLKP